MARYTLTKEERASIDFEAEAYIVSDDVLAALMKAYPSAEEEDLLEAADRITLSGLR